MKYVYVAYLYIATAYQALWKSWLWTQRVYEELRREGTPLDSADHKRIRFYLIQSLITAQWVCVLRGYRLRSVEQQNLRWTGAITPLLDDLTDGEGKPSSTFFTEANPGGKQRAVNFLYSSLMGQASNEFRKLVKETLSAQDDSIGQITEQKLSFNTLKQVTAKKGGSAMVLYRLALTNPLSSAEADAFRSLGYVLQLTNDLFDVYKDMQAGQQTLVTNCTDLSALRVEFNSAVNQVIERFAQLDCPPRRIRKCLLLISTITSRAEVCLEQLEKLAPHGTKWDPRNYSRKDLVCDMERVDNLIASFKFSIAFYDRLRWLKTP